ncbi:glycosyltransferase family 2 protein [Sungkyunkwania multivorans]|uniref:Glycosyltransferase family 2 protein n=1 Tax=Sungkyunkwania multivorans TaxID=1173618 RepID=A0ABW3D4Z9_9FLAO
MNKPLVSIIIPTYDRLALLEKTLRSVLDQSYPNMEVIVVDDGTPGDENEKLCEQFNNLSYFKIPNSGGPSRPRNVGISKAKGDYIAFLDDDDIWLPQKLEKQVEILEKHQDYGLTHCYCKVIDATGNETGDLIGRPGDPGVKHGKVTERMVGNWTLMMPTPLMRRELIDKVGNFNEAMPQAGEDVEFWVRCSLHTKFYYLDEPLVLYRSHLSNSEILSDKYVQLPSYLKEVVDQAFDDHLLTESQHRSLVDNLVKMQLKKLKDGKWRTFLYLSKLNPFWFLNFSNLKLLVKMLTA